MNPHFRVFLYSDKKTLTLTHVDIRHIHFKKEALCPKTQRCLTNVKLFFAMSDNLCIFANPNGQACCCATYCPTEGKMAERSNAAVLKTVDLRGSGGSNPSLSAKQNTHKFMQIDL